MMDATDSLLRANARYIYELEDDLRSARRCSAAWKRAAKEYRAECKVTDDLLRRAQREYSDAARAQLANAAASEVDAVQGRQECERELREVRAERRLLAQALVDKEDMGMLTVKPLVLARSILEEGAA